MVIKQLSNAIAYPPYVYGCSILADGRLTLVIDGTGLLNYVQQLPQSQPSLLKVGSYQELKVGRLKVVREAWPIGQGSEELKVSRLKVVREAWPIGQGSEELKVSRLKVVREAWPFGQGFPDKLQPDHRQPDNLQPANLPFSNAKGEQPANLQPANLQPANLQPANLQPANLQPANLQPANLQPANLQPANLQPAKLSKTFLVVDDSITERQNLSLILERNGNHVVQAKDGWEAIELLRRSSGIDLIICDLEMPRLNGLEFLSLSHQ
ncbi:MAG: response regulator, partial [Moorea sp. SIO2C4]|nr:response regulator [Moorena sp. SIO2C4]